MESFHNAVNSPPKKGGFAAGSSDAVLAENGTEMTVSSILIGTKTVWPGIYGEH